MPPRDIVVVAAASRALCYEGPHVLDGGKRARRARSCCRSHGGIGEDKKRQAGGKVDGQKRGRYGSTAAGEGYFNGARSCAGPQSMGRRHRGPLGPSRCDVRRARARAARRAAWRARAGGRGVHQHCTERPRSGPRPPPPQPMGGRRPALCREGQRLGKGLSARAGLTFGPRSAEPLRTAAR